MRTTPLQDVHAAEATDTRAERRRSQRFATSFDGRWQGAAEIGFCAISNLSLGGCFVEMVAGAVPGSRTVVTVDVDGDSCHFQGEIVYVEHGVGFGLRFDESSAADLDSLRTLIDAHGEPRPPFAPRRPISR